MFVHIRIYRIIAPVAIFRPSLNRDRIGRRTEIIGGYVRVRNNVCHDDTACWPEKVERAGVFQRREYSIFTRDRRVLFGLCRVFTFDTARRLHLRVCRTGARARDDRFASARELDVPS